VPAVPYPGHRPTADSLRLCPALLQGLPGETGRGIWSVPNCKAPLRGFPDKLSAQRIKALTVKCTAESGGCGWSGELGQLETHSLCCEHTTESVPKKRQSSSAEPHCQDALGYPGQSAAGSRKKRLSSQQMNRTETKDDVLMLHAPFLVVCFMIVCITLSSCIMGYI